VQGVRFELVNLSAPPSRLISGEDPIFPGRGEFVQDLERWAVYYYHHGNVVTINNRTYAVQEGDAAILPPGARVSHGVTGPHTTTSFIIFDMPGTGTLRGAMPHIARGVQAARQEWVNAGMRMMDGMTYLVAFTWNFMCQQSVGLHRLRGEAVLYEAEEWIRRNLGRRFTVAEMCEELHISPRHLLRSFRMEHGVTVQEYVIRRRVQEAGRLLVSTDLPPKQIAARIGIPDLQHFNKLMRQHTGLAARAFRERGSMGHGGALDKPLAS
jgi:AraC-like DNA-binding protein